MDTHQQPNIIFPENTIPVILELLEKYEITETPAETFRKIANNEPTNSRRVAAILRKVATGELLFKEVAKKIKDGLNTTQETAEEIAAELQSKILDYIEIEQPSEDITTPPPSSDTYREPV